MTTTLTPPADAPLPWALDEDGDVIAANGEIVDMDDVLSAANAYPGLVAERDAAIQRAAKAEADTVARIVQYLRVVAAGFEQGGNARRGFEYVAREIAAGAWRGKEGA